MKFMIVPLFLFFVASRGSLQAQSLIGINAPGDYSFSAGINESGQVAVTLGSFSSGSDDAEIYSNGALTDIGSLGGSYTEAYGINNAGDVVGYSTQTPSELDFNAFLYSGGTMTAVPSNTYQNLAVNNSGQTAGETFNGGHYNAFVYSNGKVTNIGVLSGTGGNSSAWGINDSGEVVGVLEANNGTSTAFLYSNNAVTNLGYLGGIDSEANAINNSGQIVGAITEADNTDHAFVYSNGVAKDLGNFGTLDAVATVISNAGVIGGYVVLNGNTTHAFTYSSEAGFADLDAIYAEDLVTGGAGSQLGFTSLDSVSGINSSGQIAGNGEYWNGTENIEEAFLLDPVPEPATWALLLSGFVGVLFLFKLKFPAARP